MQPEITSLLPPNIAQILLATVLGLFIGLEREWSEKPAGIRTFALLGLLGALFEVIGGPILISVGVFFVIVLAVLLGGKAYFIDDISGLSLTTSVTMLITYSVGVMSARGLYLESVTVAMISSLLLVLKKELHQFSLNISKNELQSAVEFLIISFVVYPLLPTENFGPWEAIDAQLIWLLVIAVSGIGFLNYILIREYDEHGFWFTGFFGGLVNSTAVIISITNRVSDNDELEVLAIGTILLANSGMALRNAALMVLFIPETAIYIVPPLLSITLGGIVCSYLLIDIDTDVDAEFSSPFSVKNALTFGTLFLIILVLTAGAEQIFGNTGFFATTFLSGLISSGTSTTTAVTLMDSGTIDPIIGVFGVIVGTIASILVKIGFIAVRERSLVKPVALWNALLIVIGVSVVLTMTFLPIW